MWPLLLALVTGGAAVVLLWPRRPPHGPPGPTPIPLIGTAAFFGAHSRDELFDVLLSLPGKFGPVVGFFVGRAYYVYVEGLDAARRAMAHPAANGRNTGYAQLQLSYGKKRGVIASEGDRWARNSQFLLNTLDKMLRSGEIETIIKDELTALTERLKRADASVDSSTVFRPPYVSLTWRIVTGDTLQYEKVAKLTKLFQGEMAAFQRRFVNSPLLCSLFPDRNGFSAVTEYRDEVRRLFLRSLKNNVPKRTFIEEFRALHESTDYLNASRVKWSPEEDEDLVMFIFDFLNGGCETTNSFHEWFIFYLLRHPQQYQLVVGEVDALGRPTTAADMARMPHVQACTAEVFRLSSLTPVGVPHRATEDLTIEGYHVPGDTELRYGIMADHHSAQLWPQPDQFRPERFLDDSGQFRRAGELSHFGIGPRVCPGRRLADVNNFLSVTHLLRQFEIRLPEGHPAPTDKPITGLTRGCRPFHVLFIPRHK